MSRKLLLSCLVAAALIAALGVTQSALAAADCTFQIKGDTMRLKSDCTTDATIFVPDGMTLDGRGNTITAVDPAGGHFTGAIVQAAGATAHVTRLVVTADGLANVCDGGAARLRGIMFEGASGSITGTTVIGINQGPSGCQEGNAIEVRNAPFDGTHPNTQTVEIAHNSILDYQKTGIVANGDVEVSIHHNVVGESATQDNLAPNSIQIGFGALGSIVQNRIDGNQWKGPSADAGTAILVFLAEEGSVIAKNNIRGNSGVGIYVAHTSLTLVDNNKVFDVGPDAPDANDYGLINFGGEGNLFTNNKVRGFEIVHFGVSGGNNKAIPGGPKAFEE